MKYIEIIADAGSFDTVAAIAEQVEAPDLRAAPEEDGVRWMRMLVRDDKLQAVLDSALDLQEEARNSLPQRNLALRVEQVLFVDVRDPCVRKMRRQYQFRLDQGEKQAQDDNDRHRLEKRTGHAAHEQHRRKGRYGRQHAKRGGYGDASRAFYDVIERMPIGANLRIDAFADDDRIIDDNTERHNKAEGGHLING